MTDHTDDLFRGLAVETHGRVLLARIHGGRHAEFGPEVAADLAALVRRAERDDRVGAVVLTGAHPARFVAHASVRWLQEGGAESPTVGPGAAALVMRAARRIRSARWLRRPFDHTPLRGPLELLDVHDTFLRMNTGGAVFIAALNGSALGAGSELALACDVRLMADGDHVIGQPEVLLGIPPGGGGTQRLTRLVGTGRALRIMLDGGGLGPRAAAEIGYVDEVVPPAELLDHALALADRLARRPKHAVGAIKRAAYLGGAAELTTGLAHETAEFLSGLGSDGGQTIMRDYVARTDETGELPCYDRPAYAAALEAGRFTR